MPVTAANPECKCVPWAWPESPNPDQAGSRAAAQGDPSGNQMRELGVNAPKGCEALEFQTASLEMPEQTLLLGLLPSSSLLLPRIYG